MKKILLLFCLIAVPLANYSQDRVDDAPTVLDYKSKELRKALYWEKNSSGKWVSRANNKIQFQSGVQSSNLTSLFWGKIDNVMMIFFEYQKGQYRYPHLKSDWEYYPRIYSAIVDMGEYNNLKDIQPNQILYIISDFSNDMSKWHPEYNFSLFLDLTQTLYKTSITLKEKRSTLYILAAQRTTSKGKDVVRFDILPFPIAPAMGIPDLNTYGYFEVAYKSFMEIFEEDTSKKYK